MIVRYKTSKKYELDERLFQRAIDGLRNLPNIGRDILSYLTGVGWVTALLGYYEKKNDNSVRKDEMMYDFTTESDRQYYQNEESKLLMIVVAACFLSIFLLNS